jgi:predicted signal transduction protein with EAL and GGDEF domain
LHVQIHVLRRRFVATVLAGLALLATPLLLYAHARPASTSVNLVRSIVQLGQSLHLDIIAEGIEDAEQARTLVGMGVRAGQGFHFAKPLDEERFAALLARGEVRDRALTEILR